MHSEDSNIAWVSQARLPNREGLWDVGIQDGKISIVKLHGTPMPDSKGQADILAHAKGGLLAPSLCHPHVHLDKAFILSHPKYRHLQISEGTFKEAMDLTSEAKRSFELSDLLERGKRLVKESSQAGVTHMRAFVEIDEIVNLTCLEAGTEIKKWAESEGLCHIQLCAFAQLALRPFDQSGDTIRSLMRQAVQGPYLVDVVGSTPYVESDIDSSLENIRWMVDLAIKHDKHLDFHLDYNVDQKASPMIHEVLKILKLAKWKEKSSKCIVLGHCTRLILFDRQQWQSLDADIADLPISFVGLPTSDLYMMKTPSSDHSAPSTEVRTTLPIPQMIGQYGLKGAIGMNNIGNAFTPQGCCDPLYLANLGVGVYQTGTVAGARLLYECVSTRAKAAIGVKGGASAVSGALEVAEGLSADLLLFEPPVEGFEVEDGIEDKVYYYKSGSRTCFFEGRRNA